MKTIEPGFTQQIIRIFRRMIFLFVPLFLFGQSVYSQISSTMPASRCGEGTLVLSATATTGTIKWYDVPFYGTPLATGTSFTTPSLPVTKTYYVDAVDGANCSLNSGSARVQVIATISANSIQSVIFYTTNTFCKSIVGSQSITRMGTAGGTYTVSPSTGLTINSTTGAITPSSSTTGTYTVTYTVAGAEGCTENPAYTSVIITDVPVTPAISYTGSPYCTTTGAVAVNQTGATGGNYSAIPSGLTLNSSSGLITPATSLSGTYTVTYFVPGAGGCSPQTATTAVTVLQLPTASISYGSPFTKNQGSQSVTLSGTGVYTGGQFSAPAGLIIDASTGAIATGTSTAGTYNVTYTLNAVSPCAQVIATTSVTIYPLPTATISGTLSVCQNSTAPDITFTGAAGTAPYTFIYKVNGGLDQIVTTTSGNSVTVTQPTSVVGAYIYTIVSVSDARSSLQAQSGTATITVIVLPVAAFNYSGTPYCSSGTNPLPTFLEGGVAGTFSSTSGLVFVSTSTGEINLAGSTAGTYTVTNTIAAAGGCGIVTATSSFTKTTLPVGTFHYASNSYCQSGTNPAVVYDGAGVAGTFTSIPAGVQFDINTPGTINLSASTPGTYQIVNTIAGATGCAEVVSTFDNLAIVAPPSTPSIAYSGSPYCNSITQAQPVELTGAVGGVFTYAVTSGGPTLSISALGAVTPNTSSPGTYTVTYSIGGGSGCTPATGTAIVVISQTPAVTNLAAYAICSGTSPAIALTASMTSTFSWTLGVVSDIILDASVSTGSPTYIDQVLSNISYTDAGTVPYLVTPVSTANACVGAPFTITVTVNPKPQIAINDPAAVCSPATVDITLAAVTTGSTPGLTLTYWTNSEATAALSSPEAVATSGTYYIKGTTASGCSEVSEVIVTVNPLPVAPTAGDVSVTYDGSVHTGTATPPASSSIVWYTASTGGSVTVAPSGTNVGTYTAWAGSKADLTPSQCESATRTLVTVQINLATPTPAVTPISGTITYTGLPQGPNAATNNGTGTSYTYSYTGVSGTTFGPGTTRPTNAGDYTATATVAANGNYTSATSAALSFTIEKVVLTITAANQTVLYATLAATVTGAGTYTPNGFVHSETAAVISGTASYTTTYTATTAAATTGVTITPVVASLAATNYSFTTATGAITISKAESTITATGATSFTYSAGVPQGPDGSTVTGSGGTVTYSYVGTGSTTYPASATKPTSEGSYTVTATVAADSNYNGKTSAAYSFQIIPLAPTGSATQTFCSGTGPV